VGPKFNGSTPGCLAVSSRYYRVIITENLLKLFYDIFIRPIMKAVRYGSFIRGLISLRYYLWGDTMELRDLFSLALYYGTYMRE
jgi:hypothetical protein